MRAGSDCGGYRILGLLGSGMSGQVFLARQLSMDRVVALKVLAPKRGTNERVEQLFIREAQVASRFNHPNIVGIHDAGIIDTNEGKRRYHAMEYVDGEDLKQLLVRDGQCDDETIARIMGDMGKAITYAANKGMVHRDIKPANIMLAQDGTAKLADFGLVRHADDEAEDRIVGSPQYMSPEQAQGLDVDYRSDQYSLGCVLYHMLCGEGPYAGLSTRETLQAHIELEPPDPAEVVECPESWRALCLRLLSKDPNDRFMDPQELLRAIDAATKATETVDEAVPGGPSAGGSPERKRRLRPRVRRAKRRPKANQRPAVPKRPARPVPRPTQRSDRRLVVEGAARRRSRVSSSDTKRPVIVKAPILIAEEAEAREARRNILLRLADLLGAVGLIVYRIAKPVILGIAWVLARIIITVIHGIVWCMPFVNAFLYRLVPPLARLYYVFAAPTWKVEIYGGHQHLFLSREDAEHGFIAAFHNGRRLPLVWRMLDRRWCAAEAGFPGIWMRESLAAFLEPLARRGAGTSATRAAAIAGRVRMLRRDHRTGVTMPIDNVQRGCCDDDVVAAAKVAGARILPTACTADTAWYFRKSWNHLMIPAPFTTVHLSFARPVPVDGAIPDEMIRHILTTELAELQERLDANRGVEDPLPVAEERR